MTEIRVLVIDDEADVPLFGDEEIRRRDAYKLIEESNTTRTKYSVVGAYSNSEYRDLTGAGARLNFDVVLLDMDLSKMPGGALSFERVISQLANRFPVIVLSRKWDTGIVSELSVAFQRGTKIYGIVDISKYSSDKDLARALASLLYEAAADWEDDQDLPILRPEDPIKIVHISDLQFGGIHTQTAKVQLHALPVKIEQAWQDYENRYGNRAHEKQKATFVVITGDIAETGLPSEYVLAYEELSGLIPELLGTGLPTKRLFLVPGNHDMTLGIANASRLKLKKRRIIKILSRLKRNSLVIKLSLFKLVKIIDHFVRVMYKNRAPFKLLNNKKWNKEVLSEYAFSPFREFAATVTGRSDWYDSKFSSWVWGGYSYLGVLFFGINTSAKVEKNGLYSPELPMADVLIDQLKPALEIVGVDATNNSSTPIEQENDGAEVPYIVGLMHHPVRSNAPGKNWVIANDDCFETIRSTFHIPLLLCGHVHDAPSPENLGTPAYPTHQLISSTCTLQAEKRQLEAGRNINLIVLERNAGKVTQARWTSVPMHDHGGLGVGDGASASYDWREL